MKNGYIRLTLPDGQRVYEHRWVYEQATGIKIATEEVVHHKNGDRTDNSPENLELMDLSAHSRLHNPQGPFRR